MGSSAPLVAPGVCVVTERNEAMSRHRLLGLVRGMDDRSEHARPEWYCRDDVLLLDVARGQMAGGAIILVSGCSWMDI